MSSKESKLQAEINYLKSKQKEMEHRRNIVLLRWFKKQTKKYTTDVNVQEMIDAIEEMKCKIFDGRVYQINNVKGLTFISGYLNRVTMQVEFGELYINGDRYNHLMDYKRQLWYNKNWKLSKTQQQQFFEVIKTAFFIFLNTPLITLTHEMNDRLYNTDIIYDTYNVLFILHSYNNHRTCILLGIIPKDVLIIILKKVIDVN